MTSDNGAISDRMEYSLYGLLTYRLGITDTPFLFNGRFGVMSDPDGLLYMQNRYYNPYLCRFINADPSGFSGGLNLYAYANGNPVSYLDPFGLGAAGEGSFSSWLDNNTYDFSPAGQFMSAYQQTQSQMQQFQSFQPDSPNGGGLSSLLNATPFVGGAKMTAEQVFTGHDLITGQSVDGLTWGSVAAIGIAFTPLSIDAAPEEFAADTGVANLGKLQTELEKLADEHLLPQFRAIDPDLVAGYTGSFKTGVVGNPNKATFGKPIDLSNFDIDYWIKSDVLYQQYGNSLKANVSFRQILSETPGFEGLKPNKMGFSIKFLPSSP